MNELQNESPSVPEDSQISNPKIPRVENSKNSFKPGTIPPWRQKRVDSYKKKELSGLDKYLIFAFTSLIIFTIAVLIIYIFTRDEPAVLVGCFFTAFGGEILMCALIKRLKLHKEMEAKKQDNTPY